MTTATITVVSSGLPRATKGGAAWGRFKLLDVWMCGSKFCAHNLSNQTYQKWVLNSANWAKSNQDMLFHKRKHSEGIRHPIVDDKPAPVDMKVVDLSCSRGISNIPTKLLFAINLTPSLR